MKIAISMLAVLLAGCALYGDQVLEAKDTQFLKVEQSSDDRGERHLIVSGLVFKSAMSVQKIDTNKHGASEINVLVHLTQEKSGLSGRFSTEVLVPTSVDVVTFGINRTPLWVRPKSNESPDK